MNFVHRIPRIERHGITVLEVLMAIVVATIGVLGIMILIPFAVRQTETGLDLDDAHRMLQNGIAQFEIEGHDQVTGANRSWMNAAGQISGTDVGVFAIDPLSVHANGLRYDQFPSRESIRESLSNADEFPVIGEVNLSVQGQPMGLAAARELFMARDDLVFLEATGELVGPEPVYDEDVAGNPIRRQAVGRMSWMAVVVPRKDDPYSVAPQSTGGVARGTGAWKYQLHCLAWKKRALDSTRSIMPIAEVVTQVPGQPARRWLRPGGTITLDKRVDGVRRNDWVMVINQDPDLEAGYQIQLAFYRVINTGPASAVEGRLSLDGPKFDFRNGPDHAAGIRTYVVHLANFDLAAYQQGTLRRQGHVVNVFERTLGAPSASNWTR